MRLSLAIDFDNTLQTQGEWLPGSREALLGLLRNHRVYIHSSRANWDGGRAQIEAALPRHHNLAGVYPKPHADLYIGDGYLNYQGDWAPILEAVRERRKTLR